MNTREMLKDLSHILERRLSGQAELIFLHCGLVGAYIAILLNNAPSFFPNSHDVAAYKWAIFWAFGSFGLGVASYQQLKSMAEDVGEDSVRMEEIGKTLDSLKRLSEMAEKAGIEKADEFAKVLRDHKLDRQTKNVPGLRSMIEVYAFWFASAAVAVLSVFEYVLALEQMQKSLPSAG